MKTQLTEQDKALLKGCQSVWHLGWILQNELDHGRIPETELIKAVRECCDRIESKITEVKS
ncbi:hypothetical protein [Pseudanabaena sp. BC1403]|uniref:hypothetical protein n=1 Tax=Pseudanabaena sp. BC1403 TaxID=2043171 RepID=UPI000CD9DCFA|nr:hypothetical protein [Pseudanabaena sp. BC1403]